MYIIFLEERNFQENYLNIMYEDATLYLKRKYDRMKYICNN